MNLAPGGRFSFRSSRSTIKKNVYPGFDDIDDTALDLFCYNGDLIINGTFGGPEASNANYNVINYSPSFVPQ